MKLQIEHHEIRTSRDEKVLFDDAEITKAEVVEYYRKVASLIVPHLEGRYLTLRRYPDGISGKGYSLQRHSDHFPHYIRQHEAATADGQKSVAHVVVENAAGLVYLADQATIELHSWLSRRNSPRFPDKVVFDLDPADDNFRMAAQAALLLREKLEAVGLKPYVMTTGSRGMHVVAPLDRSLDFDEVRAMASTLASSVVSEQPDKFTNEQRDERREGRLYLDVSRNAYGQTGIVPYSLRATAAAPVATPLDWQELSKSKLSARKYNLRNLWRRLAQKEDPWRDFFKQRNRPNTNHVEPDLRVAV